MSHGGGEGEMDFGEMGLHLAEHANHTFHGLQHALRHAAEHVQHVAKEMFGHYQGAHGPFPAWAELAESTKSQRVALGFSANDPLLRTGQMRDSISYTIDGLDAVVGSTDPNMPVHELGRRDGTIPPRPVLGPALFLSRDAISRIAGRTALGAFIGGSKAGSPITGRGYDGETAMPALNTGP